MYWSSFHQTYYFYKLAKIQTKSKKYTRNATWSKYVWVRGFGSFITIAILHIDAFSIVAIDCLTIIYLVLEFHLCGVSSSLAFTQQTLSNKYLIIPIIITDFYVTNWRYFAVSLSAAKVFSQLFLIVHFSYSFSFYII